MLWLYLQIKESWAITKYYSCKLCYSYEVLSRIHDEKDEFDNLSEKNDRNKMCHIWLQIIVTNCNENALIKCVKA